MPANTSPLEAGPKDARPSAAIAVFARTPIPGQTKTRLIPALGPEGAADFHRALVSDTLRKVSKVRGKVARYVFAAGGDLPSALLPRYFGCQRQRGRDLGERLDQAFDLLLQQQPRAVVIGTDSPMLRLSVLRLALEELRWVDAVLGPCPDGGYYLVGLRKPAPGLFMGARLGTRFAFKDTLGNILARGSSCAVLDPCSDVDRPEDLRKLKKELIEDPSRRRLMPATWRFLSGRQSGSLRAVKR